MIIKRQLKYSEWEYNETTGELKLWISIPNPNDRGEPPESLESISLNRVQLFSLFRFLVRVSQRLSRKHRKIREGGKK